MNLSTKKYSNTELEIFLNIGLFLTRTSTLDFEVEKFFHRKMEIETQNGAPVSGSNVRPPNRFDEKAKHLELALEEDEDFNNLMDYSTEVTPNSIKKLYQKINDLRNWFTHGNIQNASGGGMNKNVVMRKYDWKSKGKETVFEQRTVKLSELDEKIDFAEHLIFLVQEMSTILETRSETNSAVMEEAK